MDLSKLQASLDSAKKQHSEDSLPPVDKWDPPFCGDIGMKIKRSGQWFYQGTPIGRKKLVRLFSTILKREADNYFLVTPVEKVSVTVEDVPFVITQWDNTDAGIEVTTQTEDTFVIDANHPVELRFDKHSQTHLPYVKVRRNLWARVHQNVFYQWAEIATADETEAGTSVSLRSGDYTFNLGSL